ncbi:MAG: tetratricopeptide repeat protein [Chloroflexia bacterium]
MEKIFQAEIGNWVFLLPALVALLLYLPALNFQLVWDDTIFLRDYPTYRDPALWPTAVFRNFILSPNYFRPLALLTFVAELGLGGINPTLFHLTNVLLHVLNTALVTLLAAHLFGLRRTSGLRPLLPALAAGLLYGCHPALLEGVAFISGRFDLLMTTFLLLALLADGKVRSRWLRPLLVGTAFFLAALCKEMAVALVPAILCWHLARPDEGESGRFRWRTFWVLGDVWVYLAVFLAGAAYLGLRYAALGYLWLPGAGETPPVGPLPNHLLLVLKSLGTYLLLVVWPFTLLSPIHYSERPVPLGDPLAWLSLALLVLVVVGVVWLVRRARPAGWLALAGLLTLLPVANLLPLELSGGSYIAERYLLFPLLFPALAAGYFLRARPAGEETAASQPFPWKEALLFLYLLAGLMTVQLTLLHWRDDLTLWSWAEGRAPRSALPPTNLALQYVHQGRYALALEKANQAIALDPQNADAHDNAGLALFHLGRYAEAQTAFARATELQPENALYWNNLAGALREQGKLEEAEKVTREQALARDPTLPVAHLNLGLIYLRMGRFEEAAGAFRQALALFPPGEDTADLWGDLGQALFAAGRYAEAQGAFEEAARRQPRDPLFWAWVGRTLLEQNRLAEAESVLLQKALPLDALLPFTRLVLGDLYLRADRPDLASQHLAQAVNLLPEDQRAAAEAMLQRAQEPDRWLRLGDLLLGRGDFQGALRAFNQAAAFGAGPADVAAGLSAAYIGMQDWVSAKRILDEALQAAPEDARLYNNAGVVAREQGDLEAARQYFARAVELAPDWDLPRKNLEALSP